MNEEKFEEFKMILSTTPITQEFLYSEEDDTFLCRPSVAGTIIGIGVVPEETMRNVAEAAMGTDYFGRDFVINDDIRSEG